MTAADHGRKTAICGGLTILCGLITIIVAVVGISINLDPEIIKKCGATGYAADCSVDVRACAPKCGRRLSFSSLIDLSQTKKLLESTGQGLVAHATNVHKRELKAFARLLAHHATTYDNSCATANNNVCEDQYMENYGRADVHTKTPTTIRVSHSCKKGTDTNDCGGLVTGSPCKKGECCCSCKEGTETKATDKFSYKSATAHDDSKSNYHSQYCSADVCWKLKNSTCDFSSSDSRYVGKNWNVPAGDGCLKCCGLDKTDTCRGEYTTAQTGNHDLPKVMCARSGIWKTGSTICQQLPTDMLVGSTRSMAVAGGVLAIVGVLPATVGGRVRMMGNKNYANILGGISMCTTTLFGFLGTGIITIYLGVLGVSVGESCDISAEAISATCDEACHAARLHIKDKFCGFGKGLGATSALLIICVFLGFISMIMTCIGFSQHKTPPPQQEPQIQVVMANAAPTQGVVQPIQVQAVVAK
jgi:hypothetical protein